MAARQLGRRGRGAAQKRDEEVAPGVVNHPQLFPRVGTPCVGFNNILPCAMPCVRPHRVCSIPVCLTRSGAGAPAVEPAVE